MAGSSSQACAAAASMKTRIAVPGRDGPALLIDQSCTSCAYVALRSAAESGADIPADWAVDADGRPTTDARSALSGALLTFGGSRGANISLMVEMLAAALSGANWSLDAPAFTAGAKSPGAGMTVVAIAPAMIRAGWGRIINISMNHETMRRRGFSPYGPSKAALESETIIWSQDLSGTGVTVNALLPGGATRTGMIPNEIDPGIRAKLIDPEIMVPPLLWLCSPLSNGVTGKRLVATRWRNDCGLDEAAEAAMDNAGWP